MTLEQRARDVVERLGDIGFDCGPDDNPAWETAQDAAKTIEALLARIAELEADRAISQKA